MNTEDLLNRLKAFPRKRWIQIIAFLILFTPIQIFIIGNYYGTGFQTPVFRYVSTSLGSSIVLLSHDIFVVSAGYIYGYVTFSVILWVIAAFLLVINLICLCIPGENFSKNLKLGGILVILSGLIFLFSIVLEYGPLFHNELGISIPIGLPLIVLAGYWIYIEGLQGD